MVEYLRVFRHVGFFCFRLLGKSRKDKAWLPATRFSPAVCFDGVLELGSFVDPELRKPGPGDL